MWKKKEANILAHIIAIIELVTRKLIEEVKTSQYYSLCLLIPQRAWHPWLMPVILAIWQAESRRTTAQGQPRQIVCKTPSP
jgi:hypothetical protein